jgi:hypothetical protein
MTFCPGGTVRSLPGTKCLGVAAPKEPSRRVRSDSNTCAHLIGDCSIRMTSCGCENRGKSRSSGKGPPHQSAARTSARNALFDEEDLRNWPRPIMPCPTGRFFRRTLRRHFVPGYDHTVPLGRNILRAEALINLAFIALRPLDASGP